MNLSLMQEGVLLLNKVGNIKLDEASYCLETLLGIFRGQSSTQPDINEEGKLKSEKVNKTIFGEVTIEMMVIGELPFSFIESVAWKNFCSKVRFLSFYRTQTYFNAFV